MNKSYNKVQQRSLNQGENAIALFLRFSAKRSLIALTSSITLCLR
ncbi:hypothetical protein [Chlorogloeopsis sp. ULAP02]